MRTLFHYLEKGSVSDDDIKKLEAAINLPTESSEALSLFCELRDGFHQDKDSNGTKSTGRKRQKKATHVVPDDDGDDPDGPPHLLPILRELRERNKLLADGMEDGKAKAAIDLFIYIGTRGCVVLLTSRSSFDCGLGIRSIRQSPRCRSYALLDQHTAAVPTVTDR